MKRIISILILLGIAAGALAVNPFQMVIARKNAGGAADYTTDLEHRWEGNDLTDSVGSADLTAVGDAAASGGVYVLDGDVDHFYAVKTVLQGRTNWTFTAWVYNATAISVDKMIIAYPTVSSSTTAIWLDNAATDTLAFRVEDGGADTGSALGANAFPNTEWEFVAVSMTGDGNVFSMRNNVVEATYTGGAVSFVADTSTNVFFGANSSATAELDGNLDDMRIYGAALTTNQIIQIYDATKGLYE